MKCNGTETRVPEQASGLLFIPSIKPTYICNTQQSMIPLTEGKVNFSKIISDSYYILCLFLVFYLLPTGWQLSDIRHI